MNSGNLQPASSHAAAGHVSAGKAASLLLAAAPAAAASVLLLHLSAVESRLVGLQAAAIAAAAVLSWLGSRFSRRGRRPAAATILAVAAAGLGATLLQAADGPRRWIGTGAFNLYVAPLLLPSFLLAWAAMLRRRGRSETIAWAAALVTGLLLAAQPDASQVTALSLGLLAVVARERRLEARPGAVLVIMAAFTAWAFSRPDPLAPVPHVEGVFLLAAAHSPACAVGVAASAVALVAGLAWRSSNASPGWLGVAVYYAVLFACSLAGLTPAPLIGFGAGPVLGYGLMAAVQEPAPPAAR